jgi:LysM repeat protein
MNKLASSEEPLDGVDIYLKDEAPKKPATRPAGSKPPQVVVHVDPLRVTPKPNVDPEPAHVPVTRPNTSGPVFHPVIHQPGEDDSHTTEAGGFKPVLVNPDSKPSTPVVKPVDLRYPEPVRPTPKAPEVRDPEPVKPAPTSAEEKNIDPPKIIPMPRKHTVIQGETLYRISKNYNTTPDAIRLANNLKDNTLSVGQELVIPSQ